MGALEQTRGLDAQIAKLAERQHGVVARRQLVALGAGRRAIEGRLRLGRLHRLHHGVYAVGHRALTRRSRWAAAVLAGGPGAVLSHRAAAALWGIRETSSGSIEITVTSKSRSRGAIRRHFAELPADEVTTRHGIPVTTVPRTLLDLAATESADLVESAMRRAEYLRLDDRLSLPDLLARYPRRRGARAIRVCLARRAERTGHTRSPLEERFLSFLDRHRLPRPQLNAWINLGGRSVQVDCLWPERRQIVELDGFRAHGTKAAFREDRARDRLLRVAGYEVTRIAWAQLEREPEELARDLRTLLAKYKRP